MILQIIAKLRKGEAVLSVDENTETKEKITATELVNVIYQTAEYGLGDTIKLRLLAAGQIASECWLLMIMNRH